MNIAQKILVGLALMLAFWIGWCVVTLITPKSIASTPTKVETEVITGKDVYVSDNMNDESSAIVNPNETVSYWYVSYTARIKKPESEYVGYKVISIPHPYFDVKSAIFEITPKYTEEDYVGISFFKRVPFETYKAYIELK